MAVYVTRALTCRRPLTRVTLFKNRTCSQFILELVCNWGSVGDWWGPRGGCAHRKIPCGWTWQLCAHDLPTGMTSPLMPLMPYPLSRISPAQMKSGSSAFASYQHRWVQNCHPCDQPLPNCSVTHAALHTHLCLNSGEVVPFTSNVTCRQEPVTCRQEPFTCRQEPAQFSNLHHSSTLLCWAPQSCGHLTCSYSFAQSQGDSFASLQPYVTGAGSGADCGGPSAAGPWQSERCLQEHSLPGCDQPSTAEHPRRAGCC